MRLENAISSGSDFWCAPSMPPNPESPPDSQQRARRAQRAVRATARWASPGRMRARRAAGRASGTGSVLCAPSCSTVLGPSNGVLPVSEQRRDLVGGARSGASGATGRGCGRDAPDGVQRRVGGLNGAFRIGRPVES